VGNERETDYKLGSPLDTYKGERTDVKQICFVVTQNCNLACRYCYMFHKNNAGRMSFDTARRAVNFFLEQDYPQGSVVWEFIGGEPLLEIDLIDRICDYIKLQTYRRNHKWRDHYRILMSTNGVLYDDPRVQRFIDKHRACLEMGITIDGTREKHDMNRVYPDGRGTYDDVIRNIPLWQKQFSRTQTKVTFGREDLPLLKESIIHLWNLGLTAIPANVVFEDVWQPGDDEIFEQQLRSLADHIIDNELWDEFNCTLFADTLGFPNDREGLKSNWCGAGMMVSVDHQGLLYPCTRFLPYCMNKQPIPYVLGDIERGIDPDRLRPFIALSLETQSSPECIDCEVATGCAWCQGWNYDSADTPTIYQRATHICDMHKARVRVNEYYWARLARKTNIRRRFLPRRRRHLYILAAEDAVAHCAYRSREGDSTPIRPEILQQGLEFARFGFYRPVVLHSVAGPRLELSDGFDPLHIVSGNSRAIAPDDLVVHENDVRPEVQADTAILILDRERLPQLAELLGNLIQTTRRINLMLRDVGTFSDVDLTVYEAQLRQVAADLIKQRRRGRFREVNVLTDRLELESPEDCTAGVHSLALAPNGRFYICPAFYHHDPEASVGSLAEGVDQTALEMCRRHRAPLCIDCVAYHCKRCLFDNQRRTWQLNVPSRMQCVVTNTELTLSAWLRQELEQAGYKFRGEPISVPEHLDPIEATSRWQMAYRPNKPSA